MKKKWARYKKNTKMGALWARDGHNKNFQNITHQLKKSAKKCAHRAKMCVFFFQGGKWADGWRDEKRLFFLMGVLKKKKGSAHFWKSVFWPFLPT